MGRPDLDPVHCLGSRAGSPVVAWTWRPRIVLRRSGGRFFGKIIKVSLIVTLCSSPRLPGLLARRRLGPPAAPLREPLRSTAAVAPWWVGAWLVTAGIASAQAVAPGAGPTGSVYQRAAQKAAAAVTAAAPSDDQAVQAERIVAASLAALGRADSISARVRQRVRVDDRVLVGAGRYVQSGLGEDQRYRYESSMQSDTETFDLLEVCDGLFAWSYRRIGPQPPYLERLDVRRMRERLRQVEPAGDAVVSPHLGGVQRTLALVRTWFRFHTVEAAAIDEVPIWKIEGRWHGESLALLYPAVKDAALRPGGIEPAELPDGTPWCVRLSIGKRDLFPFRIEWLAIPGRRPVAARDPETVAVIEMYDVRLGEPVDAAAFVYKPAIEGLVDLTDTRVKFLAPLRP
ncbi:MAG: hypothetical protein RLZZ111_1065 [Planctomycetota bacterium]|jgi:hypothetical protein